MNGNPFISSPNATIFRQQQRRLRELLEKVQSTREPHPRIERASPKRVLTFVEWLLVCPDEAAVLTHIAQDQEAAEIFQGHARDMANAIDIKSAASGFERAQHETPFYLLASVFLKSARLAVENLGDDWRPLNPK